MPNNINTTSMTIDDLMELVGEYAEARHTQGHSTYNAQTSAARDKVVAALAGHAAYGVGNSGFDHKTAADFLSGKTVSDEALRKFVQASRWAHDDRASLRAQLLSLSGILESRDAEIALLKKLLMEAEAAPQPATADALSIEDATLLEKVVTDFEECGETDVPDATLRRFAEAGYLECAHYRVMPAAKDAIDAAHGIKGDSHA